MNKNKLKINMSKATERGDELEQAIHVAVQSSNQEQKKLVDEYDRIGKYLEEFDQNYPKWSDDNATTEDDVRDFIKLSLLSYEQEVRKEVLESEKKKQEEIAKLIW